MGIPKGYFRSNYTLKGRDWIRRISREDLLALAHIGFEASDYGRTGGVARAKSALRDERGRFVSDTYILRSQNG